MEIYLDGKEVCYEIRPSRRARRLGLTIYPGGKLVLTLPHGASNDRIRPFLLKYSQWIARNLKKSAQKKKLPGGAKDYRENKERARLLVEKRLRYFNGHYGFKVGRISIRDTRSRWGSCSRKGNLSFSYKLVHVSPEVADYVIVHELSHLRHFDHSPAFWATVAETIPTYKKLRKELRSFVH